MAKNSKYKNFVNMLTIECKLQSVFYVVLTLCSAIAQQGNVRLVGLQNTTEGIVEVFVNGEWGTICDDQFDIKEAHVICRMLGFPGAIAAVREGRFGVGKGKILLDELGCRGNESSILQCPHGGVGIHNCKHTEDVGVICEEIKPDYTKRVRLRDGRTPNEGRIEIFINGQWGTICHDMFDINNAHLFCRLLGYGNASLAVLGSTFGQGSGPVWLDDLQCTGTEPSFFQCQHLPFGRHNCHGHLGDAGVMCGSEIKLGQVLSTPSGVKIAELSTHSAIVLWDMPSVTYSENIGYLVYINNEEKNQTIHVPAERTYIKLDGLQPSTWYNVSVQAVSGVSKGNMSKRVDFRTLRVPHKTPPAPPVNLTINHVTSGSAFAVWNMPMVNTILAYHFIVLLSSDDNNKTYIRVSGGQTYLNITNLQPSTKYSVTVQAVSSELIGNSSNVVFFNTRSKMNILETQRNDYKNDLLLLVMIILIVVVVVEVIILILLIACCRKSRRGYQRPWKRDRYEVKKNGPPVIPMDNLGFSKEKVHNNLYN